MKDINAMIVRKKQKMISKGKMLLSFRENIVLTCLTKFEIIESLKELKK